MAHAATMLTIRRLRPAAPYVLVPTAALLLAAMDGSRDFGGRYAIFVPVFLAVAAGCVDAYRARWAHLATLRRAGQGRLISPVSLLERIEEHTNECCRSSAFTPRYDPHESMTR